MICQLVGSKKWPDDLQAFRRLKAAFHIKLVCIYMYIGQLIPYTNCFPPVICQLEGSGKWPDDRMTYKHSGD